MKNWKPSYLWGFWKKNLDPQLHQIFKPIRKFFCTFLPLGVSAKKKSALKMSDTDISSTATPSLPITRLCPLGAKYAHFLWNWSFRMTGYFCSQFQCNFDSYKYSEIVIRFQKSLVKLICIMHFRKSYFLKSLFIWCRNWKKCQVSEKNRIK